MVQKNYSTNDQGRVNQNYKFHEPPGHGFLRKFYGRYNDLVCPYDLSLSQVLYDMFQDNCKAVFIHWFWLQIAPFVTRLDNWLTAGMTDQQGMLTPARHLIPPQVYPGAVFDLHSVLDFFLDARWLRLVIFVFWTNRLHVRFNLKSTYSC